MEYHQKIFGKSVLPGEFEASVAHMDMHRPVRLSSSAVIAHAGFLVHWTRPAPLIKSFHALCFLISRLALFVVTIILMCACGASNSSCKIHSKERL